MSRKAQHKNKTGLKGVPRFGSKALNYWSVWKVEINPITPDEKGNETESGKTLIYVTFHSEKKIAEMEVKDCIKKYGGAHCRAFEYDRIDWTEEEAIAFLSTDKGKKPNNKEDITLI